MRKQLFIGAMLIGLCFTVQNANAQLTVADNGNVGIHLADNVNPLSKLAIGGAGNANTKIYVQESGSGGGNQIGVYSYLSWGTANNWKYALYGYSRGIGGQMVGVRGKAEPANTNQNANVQTYGIYGVAGGANYGQNYGVFGLLQSGDAYGAGVYGTNDGTAQTLSARFAGFFRGQTKVNGDFFATTVTTTSDARLKTEITDVKNDVLHKVGQLHPIQFKWQQVEDVIIEDTITIKTPHFSTDIDFERQHYGFLAQDVQKIFPELVHEDGTGYLGVDYMELIPLLVQAVQELSAEVTELKSHNNK